MTDDEQAAAEQREIDIHNRRWRIIAIKQRFLEMDAERVVLNREMLQAEIDEANYLRTHDGRDATRRD
jgi:hypothetical protein